MLAVPRAALLTGRYPIRTGVDFFTTFKVLYYYRRDRLTAIRADKYKLHFAKTTRAYHWVDCEKFELYDLEVDPSEKYDLADKHPEIVARLTKRAQDFRDEISGRNENRELLDEISKRWKK